MGPKQEPGPTKSQGGDHFGNFIEAVRTRKRETLNAEIEEGAISCVLMHWPTATGLPRIALDEKTWTVKGDSEATKMLTARL
jgi:hypothetical protein